MPLETFGPVILAQRARAVRKNGCKDTFAPIELEAKGVKQMLTVTLIRPILMYTDAVVACSCLYLSLEYGIFYIFFEAYPIVFQGKNAKIPPLRCVDPSLGIYHMTPGVAALTLIPGLCVFAIICSPSSPDPCNSGHRRSASILHLILVRPHPSPCQGSTGDVVNERRIQTAPFSLCRRTSPCNITVLAGKF